MGAVNLFRKAVKDVTLSDGTRIPKGTLVAAAAVTAHSDDTRYTDPMVFDPFRFARMREGEGEGTKHQMVHTSVEYMPFGHGRHACPGRFFAASELKLMLAYIVLNYDFEFQQRRPENFWFAQNRLPPMKAEIRIKIIKA